MALPNSAKANGFWRGPDYEPVFTDTLALDMGSVEPSLAGPKRPQDRVPLKGAARAFYKVVADYRGMDMTDQARFMADEGGATIDDFLAGFPTVRREQVVALLHEATARLTTKAS